MDVHMQKDLIGPFISCDIKNYHKMDKKLNEKAKNIKLLGASFCDLGLGNVFLDMTPKAQATTENFDKLDFIKVKNLWASMDAIRKVKCHRRGENI